MLGEWHDYEWSRRRTTEPFRVHWVLMKYGGFDHGNVRNLSWQDVAVFSGEDASDDSKRAVELFNRIEPKP